MTVTVSDRRFHELFFWFNGILLIFWGGMFGYNLGTFRLDSVFVDWLFTITTTILLLLNLHWIREDERKEST